MYVDNLKMKPGGQLNNKNAVKDEGKATSHLHIRVTPEQKATWVKAANGKKLSEWVIETLNALK
jgi:hypothetical protein